MCRTTLPWIAKQIRIRMARTLHWWTRPKKPVSTRQVIGSNLHFPSKQRNRLKGKTARTTRTKERAPSCHQKGKDLRRRSRRTLSKVARRPLCRWTVKWTRTFRLLPSSRWSHESVFKRISIKKQPFGARPEISDPGSENERIRLVFGTRRRCQQIF